MDNLTDNEKILAWEASWNPSFSGIAIVNEDFTFRSVNPQFCKLLGVTPAELLGNRFQDITHPSVRKLDEQNAKLLIEGKTHYYLLEKKYLFEDGREVDVVLLVTRAPQIGDFQFFLSRIMLNEAEEAKSLNSGTYLQKLTGMGGELLKIHGKTLLAVGTVLGTTIAVILRSFGVGE